MSATPKSSWGWVKALLHSIYDQPDAEAVHAQFDRVVDALTEKLPAVADHLEAARTDVFAFTGFPRRSGARSGPTTPTSASTARSDATPTSSESSPDLPSIIRLVGAVLAEQHDECAEGRRYLGLDVLAKYQTVGAAAAPTDEEVKQAVPQAGPHGLTKNHEGSDLVHHVTGLDLNVQSL